MSKITVCLCLLSLVVAFCYTITYAQREKEVAFTGDFKPYFANNRIVIKLNTELDKSVFRVVDGTVVTSIQSIDALNAKYGVKVMTQLFPGSESVIQAAEIGLSRIFRIQFSPTQNLTEIVETYANDPNVEYAQPVAIHKVLGITPNDPYFYRQWGLTNIQAPNAWDLTQGDTSVILAIVDTGVDWLHPDLGETSPYVNGNIWTNWTEYFGATSIDDDSNGYVDDIRGWDWVDVASSSFPPWPGEDGTVADNNPMDFNGHGTHCAGIASAITNNGTGVAGVGWNCKIMALRAGWSADYYGYEVGLIDMDFCAQAIYYAARNGASAINCSWGSSNTGGIADAVTFATSMGVQVVVAAGNDDVPDASYLCSRHDCITVAATDLTNNKSSYSSYGYWVDVSAPGGDSPPTSNEIYSTYYDHYTDSHDYEWLIGTSMAAPHAVGLIGLINSQFPGLTWQGIKERILYTSDNIDAINPNYKNGLLGDGIINAFSAVSQTNIPFYTVFFTENFDTGLPSTWTADPYWRDDDPGNKNTLYDDTYEPGTIKVGYDIWTPPFMIVDSDYAGSVNIDASLVTPIIDCSMYSDIRLVFNNWFQNYKGRNNEKGDIDIRIDGGPWQNVANFTSDITYNIVDAGREVVVRLPSSVDYQSNVQIRWRYYDANDELFWGIDDVKLIGTMIATDYYVQLFPSFQTSGGQIGDTTSYMKKVKNIGLLSDSYDLSVSNNSWTTTIWDSAGINQVSNTGILASREEFYMMIRVEIPASAVLWEVDTAYIIATSTTDTSIFAQASIMTFVQPPPDTIPWYEEFFTLTIDTTKWTYNKGPAEVSTRGLNPPSPPYSLNLNGDISGGDEIHSCAIDISGESQVVLSYHYQRTGGGDSPESGDDLWVEYYSSSGSWMNLKQYPGSGPDMDSFTYDFVVLPSDAYHTDFRFRFRNFAMAGNYDDWFIDNILLVQAPDIFVTYTPDPFNFNLDLGDSTTATITIENEGGSNLDFTITDRPSDSLSFSTYNLNHLSYLTVQDIVKANYEHAKAIPKVQPGSHGIKNSSSDFDRAPTELSSFNFEDMLKSFKNSNSMNVIKAVVLDGWGTYSQQAISSWNYLNLNYGNFGIQAIIIDYTTLDIDNITYQDIVNSKADVLIIPDNWGYYSSGDQNFYLTASECQAVVQYVNEGHGLYLSAGTLNNAPNPETQPQVDYLAELLGLNPSALYDWGGGPYASPVNLIDVSHPIFTNIPNPYLPDFDYSCAPITGNWNDVVTTGKVLAISNDNQTAIIGKQNRIYFSALPSAGTAAISDYQFLYNVIVFAGTAVTTTSWLSYNPVSDTVKPDSSVDVEVKVKAVDLLPDSTYHRNVNISSNDPDEFENPFTIQASLTVNPTDFYFRIIPTFRDSSGKAGDTLAYKFKIKNFGQLTDSYDLSASENDWSTTFWDSTGITPITNTGPVASKAEIEFIVKTEILSSSNYGDVDTAKIHVTSVGKPVLSRYAVIQTASVGTPASIPWTDEFPTRILDPKKWIYNSGPAEVNDLGIHEPSPPYSLNLNGETTGGDEVQSELIDLSNDSLIILSYYYQRTGGGSSPDYGDDLWIDYQTSNKVWVNLRQYLGSESDDTTFTLEEIVLPSDAYHNAFRLRFRCKGDYGDDWFVDNVFVSRPPEITVASESYDVTVIAGDSVEGKPALAIGNVGDGILRYKILSLPSSGAKAKLELEPATRNYPDDYYSIELEKGDMDPRKGVPVINRSGGPDNFGYYWIDSSEPEGPAFNWIDITNVGTRITGLGDDNNVGFFQIGFAFPFYDYYFHMLRFCTNGFISFTSSSTDSYNDPIPNQSVFNLIAPFWDDLEFDPNSSAYYHSDGQKLIIQYNNVLRDYSTERNTFEIILYKNGTIVFQYLLMQSSSNSATIGIQDSDGSNGLEIAFNTNYVHDRLAIYISTAVPWIKIKPTAGTLPKDSTITTSIWFTAEDFDVDTVLHANIVIRSNDPADSIVVIPARMKVITNEIISGTILSNGNPLDGAVAQVWDKYPNGSIIDQYTTSADGKYFLLVPPEGGMYDVRAHATGYVPAFKEDVPGNIENLNFTLKPVEKISPTTEWVDFFSDNSKFWGGPVQIGDVITAEDPDSVACGIYTVDESGYYGFMPVYKDDDTTPEVDEGAQAGDTITFRINGYLAEALGPDTPVWMSHGSIIHVDLNVEEIDTLNIPLFAGWNLISWNVDTPEDSTHIILKDVMSNVIVVLSYELGGLTYEPSLPKYNNLTIMDHLHGYWIKMAQEDILKVIGNPVDHKQTPIYCESGWNLVSYLPKEPDSVTHAFDTVVDNTVRAYGFKNGGMTYDPKMPEFSTLHVLSKTFGYWIYLNQNDTLTYPEPLPNVICPYEDLMLFNVISSAGQNRGSLIPTNEWFNVFGEGIKLDGKLLSVETRIRAIDHNGVLCGEFVVTTPGKFGFMPIYRDDPNTDIDEGAKPGDEISIYFNDFEIPVKLTWKKFGDVVDLGTIITSVAGELRNLPTEYQLSHNYPNPFNPETTIKYQLPKPGFVTLKIYNMLGQAVRTLVAEEKKAGYYQIIWDGRDSQGQVVANGIYLYQLKAGNFEKTRKMIMLK